MTPSRVEAFTEALASAGFAAAVVSYHRDVLYLTGTAQPCNLLIVPGRRPTLFARRFADLARAQSHVEDVVEDVSLTAVRDRLEAWGVPGGRLGMPLDVLPTALYRKASAAFDGFTIDDVAPLLAKQRMIKDQFEVAKLRRAAALFVNVHDAMCAHLRPGVTELELSSEILRRLRRAGHDGVVFYRRWDASLHPEGAVASGENLCAFSGQAITITGTGLGPAVPFGASRRALQQGDVVNVDLGLVSDGYHADMARTYTVGEPHPDVVALAGAIRALQDAALDAIRPGAAAHEIYDATFRMAQRLAVASFFQGWGTHHGPYIGHGLGLELDEWPVLGPAAVTELRAGMVLAVEPKLTVPGVGAVNLEDDVLVTTDGFELLTAFPREVFLVERGRALPVRAMAASEAAAVDAL